MRWFRCIAATVFFLLGAVVLLGCGDDPQPKQRTNQQKKEEKDEKKDSDKEGSFDKEAPADTDSKKDSDFEKTKSHSSK